MFNFIVIVGFGGFVAVGLCIAFAIRFAVSLWDKELGERLENEYWGKMVVVCGMFGAIVVYMINYH